MYPIIHFTEDRKSLISVLQDQHELNEHFKLHQGMVSHRNCMVTNANKFRDTTHIVSKFELSKTINSVYIYL